MLPAAVPGRCRSGPRRFRWGSGVPPACLACPAPLPLPTHSLFRPSFGFLTQGSCWTVVAFAAMPLSVDTGHNLQHLRGEVEMLKKHLKEREENDQGLKEAKRKAEALQAEAEARRAAASPKCSCCNECLPEKRSSIFHALGNAYCSSACVQKHRRMLAALAAERRMKSS